MKMAKLGCCERSLGYSKKKIPKISIDWPLYILLPRVLSPMMVCQINIEKGYRYRLISESTDNINPKDWNGVTPLLNWHKPKVQSWNDSLASCCWIWCCFGYTNWYTKMMIRTLRMMSDWLSFNLYTKQNTLGNAWGDTGMARQNWNSFLYCYYSRLGLKEGNLLLTTNLALIFTIYLLFIQKSIHFFFFCESLTPNLQT